MFEAMAFVTFLLFRISFAEGIIISFTRWFLLAGKYCKKMVGRPERITVGGELLGGLTMFGIYSGLTT